VGDRDPDGAPFVEPSDVVVVTSTDGGVRVDTAFVLDRRGQAVYVFERAGTAINAESESLPAAFSLGQNYPNPFNPSTSIPFAIERSGHVRLTVHDLLGREIIVVSEGFREAGSHAVMFDASSLTSGVYLYRLEAGASSKTRTLHLIK
ncbi:MAG: T9SS type A sorting domain-containing protein, partial [Bacteroidota bacterium]